MLELTSAYATFANAGRYLAPYSIETIIDSDRNVVESHTPEPQEAVSAVWWYPEASWYLGVAASAAAQSYPDSLER